MYEEAYNILCIQAKYSSWLNLRVFENVVRKSGHWIENCDSKTSIILGSFGVIAGIFLATDYVSKLKSIFCHMTSNVSF